MCSDFLAESPEYRLIRVEFVRSFLKLCFAGKPAVTSRNVGCFVKLWSSWLQNISFSHNYRYTVCLESWAECRPATSWRLSVQHFFYLRFDGSFNSLPISWPNSLFTNWNRQVTRRKTTIGTPPIIFEKVW